jgi:glycosyltransferase involved in cell wall biosynthesis
MRIVVWGTYDLGKPRVRIMLRGLRENGVLVHECHSDVWSGVEDKSQLNDFMPRLRALGRWFFSYPKLIWCYLKAPKHDVVLVPYMGHLDVLLLWPFAKLRGAKLVWDAFLSLYNTIVEDRRLLSAHNPFSKIIWFWEWMACRVSDCIIMDTRAHADYFKQNFNINQSKIVVAFVGAEPEAFPILNKVKVNNTKPVVLFYGQFIPLHGIETIIKAAQLAKNESIDWIIIGRGQEETVIRAMLDADPLPRLKWISWVSYVELSNWISCASVCLGIFGNTDKAGRVIPNKVFQILMSGKPLVTRDSPAMRELIEPGQSGIWLVPPANPLALIEAVRLVIRGPVFVKLHSAIRKRINPYEVGTELIANIKMNLFN